MSNNAPKNLQNCLLEPKTTNEECTNGLTSSNTHNKQTERNSSYSFNHSCNLSNDEKELANQLKIFPVFGDKTLAKLSLNYYLYFEFYHSAIRLLFPSLIFSVIVYLLCLFAPSLKTIDNHSRFNNIPFFYFLRYETLEKEEENEEETGIPIFIIAVLAVITNFLFVFSWTREKRRILKADFLYEDQWSENLFSILVEGLPNDTTSEEIKTHFDMMMLNKKIEGQVQDVILLQDSYEYVEIVKRLSDPRKQTADELSRLEERRKSIENELTEGKKFPR